MGTDRNRWRLGFSVLIVALFINPIVERLDGVSPLVFMLSHYALFGAGILVGSSLLELRGKVWVIGAAVAVFWHIPQMFALSADLTPFRILEETTMFVGGFSVGSNAGDMTQKTRTTLITLWVAGDTLLSVLFIGEPTLYSDVPYSPYGSTGFPAVGVAMVLLMNALLGYVVYDYAKKVRIRVAQKNKNT